MKAREHTASMLRWWNQAGVVRSDLAVKRPSGKMAWHRDLPLEELPLSWARAENAHGAEVYIRPARGYSWGLLLLDDVSIDIASRMARKYDALVISTSEIGGCHVWLQCSQELDEESRLIAQRWLAARANADLGSVSGEHLGRLAGFKNWKRGGTWVNILVVRRQGSLWDPAAALHPPTRSLTRAARHQVRPAERTSPAGRPAPDTDTTESGREWGWVCSRLEAGHNPSTIYEDLVTRARSRRGRDTERYAARTLCHALRHKEVR